MAIKRKIQSNKSWYKAISNVNPIFYKSSFNNPLTTIPPQQSSNLNLITLKTLKKHI